MSNQRMSISVEKISINESIIVNSDREKWEKRDKADLNDKSPVYGLFATIDIKANECVYDWKGSINPTKKSRLSTQFGKDEHILFNVDDFQYYNHSCDPNVAHDFEKGGTYAIKDICPGQELLFFYPACEWNMEAPFLCKCGSPNCLGLIKGAKYVPVGRLKRLMPMMAPHCIQLLTDYLLSLFVLDV